MLSLFPFYAINQNNQKLDDNINLVDDEIRVFDEISLETLNKLNSSVAPVGNNVPVIKSYYGPMTAYGPDCVGCIGITSSGYNVLNGNIYYNDKTYGNIRILAADKSLPFGTIVRIGGLNVFDEDILAIVLDRGSAIGFNKKSYFDLLYNSEKETEFFGRRYATFDILRMGY